MQAQDTVYPSAYNIGCDYSPSSDKVAISDTFTIARYLVNDESFNLSGLYFSDNLPPEFVVVDYDVRVNGVDRGYEIIGPVNDHLLGGYNTYYWILDSRGEFSGIDYVVNPGDSVGLEMRIVCGELGTYALPAHATSFYGNGTGFFASSDMIEVEIVLSLDVEEDDPNILPGDFLISKAYPNPFNSAVVIGYSGLGLTGGEFDFMVYDITGRKIYENSFVSGDNSGYINWEPEKDLGSGVYFYRLSDGKSGTGGKVVLLK